MNSPVNLPSVFIGSSTDGLEVVRTVALALKNYAEPHLWQHIFEPGKGTFESLVAAAKSFDFAVLVLTPDDLIMHKDVVQYSPRDNVLFELGLFTGTLSRDRTFAIYDEADAIRLPTDLAGVTQVRYKRYRSGNLPAAVDVGCIPIANAIRQHGKLRKSLGSWDVESRSLGPEVNPRWANDVGALEDKWDLTDVINNETVFIVVGGRVISELLDRPLARSFETKSTN